MRSRYLTLLVALAVAGCGEVQPKREQSWTGAVSPAQAKIAGLLADGDRVALAVITTADAAYSAETFKANGGDIVQWRAGMSAANTAGAEAQFLRMFGANPRFQLVDRTALDKITSEWSLSADSDVSDETRVKIGELTGATHLFVTRILRSPGVAPGSVSDSAVSRLIDARTGQVLASQIQSITNHP